MGLGLRSRARGAEAWLACAFPPALVSHVMRCLHKLCSYAAFTSCDMLLRWRHCSAERTPTRRLALRTSRDVPIRPDPFRSRACFCALYFPGFPRVSGCVITSKRSGIMAASCTSTSGSLSAGEARCGRARERATAGSAPVTRALLDARARPDSTAEPLRGEEWGTFQARKVTSFRRRDHGR